MALQSILIFCFFALFIRLVGKGRLRRGLILGGSALAVFWLQPEVPIRYADYWLPCVSILLVTLGWIVVTPPDKRSWKENWQAAAVLMGAVLLVGFTRMLSAMGVDLGFHAPPMLLVGMVLAGGILFILVVGLLSRKISFLPLLLMLLILVIFIWLKTPALEEVAFRWLRGWAGQSTDISRMSDISLRWLGFSYLAFRLIHTLRDRQVNRLPAVTLEEYASYVLFFPSLAAGPIDRIQHFVGDLRKPPVELVDDLTYSGRRLMIGLFKKFVLADTLALISLSVGNASQLNSAGWTWVVVYAYALQIFLDFSGYTDIAIAIGRLVGIQLPENFNKPYLQSNLTQFWNNWHMSLTQWFRSYFFNPLTRSLRKSHPGLTVGIVILLTQVGTMTLIGLWHGVTWNFVLWGMWHGVGLFVQNRWSEWIKTRSGWVSLHPVRVKLAKYLGVFLTFQFVALGWVWFALPEPALSVQVLMRMFGAGNLF